MSRIAVIGAGIFGSTIAASLARDGHDVFTIDDGRPGSGSSPAACLLKPSWFSSLGPETYNPALRKLDDLYGVQDIAFKVGPLSTTVHWVRPSKILQPPNYRERVTGLQEPKVGNWIVHTRDAHFEADRVVVATGVWANELVPTSRPIKGQAGMAFLWPDHEIDNPFISVWAPYRQLVAFDRGDGLWCGDGTSILYKNWTQRHAEVSEERCARAVDLNGLDMPKPKRLFGIRPYTDMKPALLDQVRPNLWVATGGAKNGTLAAGWCADQLSRRFA